MELHRYVFIGALASVSLCALRFGGGPERSAVAINVAGSVASLLIAITVPHNWAAPVITTWAVDLVVLAAFAWLMLASDRWWTSWNLAFAIDANLAHLGKIMRPSLGTFAYYVTEAHWAYPAIAALGIGTLAHHRRRKMSSSSSG